MEQIVPEIMAILDVKSRHINIIIIGTGIRKCRCSINFKSDMGYITLEITMVSNKRRYGIK